MGPFDSVIKIEPTPSSYGAASDQEDLLSNSTDMAAKRKNSDGNVTSGGSAEKILVVGAGAAGMACAWSLARFPDKFEVQSRGFVLYNCFWIKSNVFHSFLECCLLVCRNT